MEQEELVTRVRDNLANFRTDGVRAGKCRRQGIGRCHNERGRAARGGVGDS